jgi:hypothetical protein
MSVLHAYHSAHTIGSRFILNCSTLLTLSLQPFRLGLVLRREAKSRGYVFSRRVSNGSHHDSAGLLSRFQMSDSIEHPSLAETCVVKQNTPVDRYVSRIPVQQLVFS